MPRRLRNVQPGVVYEITHRTRDGRFAFVPDRQLVDELCGVIGEAQARWPQVELHQIHFLSNHVTMEVSVREPHCANALSSWTNYVFGESAKVSQVVHGLKGEIWESKRYRLVPILDEASLRERTKYIMAQAVAAELVRRPRHWPGLNSCDAVCRGGEMVGYRANAALRRQARRDKVPLASIAPRREVKISPLPMHRGWPEHRRQAWYRAIEREIVEEAAAAGFSGESPEALRRVSPKRTVPLEASDAPSCYAELPETRRTWRTAMQAFTRAWREALAAWIDGARACFPPHGWVPFGACYAPGYAQRE